ncbi:ABC transporter ATP-binding protein [Pseudochelatococcus contaminans]|uniref:Branched-chain amino acid transport system ATP-binding protein n=1 Tax=Pseudochelatococcus contaminans TaxID=1538103 RepID=A0A7W5Z3S7_9HYPH|nr:ABC transporter ATP-binding protein [Pseudochelatococcus contaminans]MBB3809635.1 branched-chain amino acid transport system ATP-binding protein [Pseudochelatococcus contaminans]
MGALLEVSGLKVNFGHVEAVKGIDFSLTEGQITTLVGANGAGKSTTLLALSGLVRKAAGQVVFGGQNITRLPSHRIVHLGLSQVAEGRAMLTKLTVRENLELGAYHRRDTDAITSDFDHVLELFPRLRERLDGYAGNLSGGEQQMLAIGRAVMARPRILLLDEPSMGLAPLIVQEIFRIIKMLNDEGLTIFLVEQNVRQALKIAHQAYVIETGEIVLQGTGEELLDHPRVLEAYLGI